MYKKSLSLLGVVLALSAFASQAESERQASASRSWSRSSSRVEGKKAGDKGGDHRIAAAASTRPFVP
ncbi:Uncharacterised protein [Klebsiella variicola]|uniref:Uncharacterized protein n=1 Tax=Klebsiella variicola TaxID=244366 RepID=A0A7H4MH38_KLEVA|nr:Uncharacterised protein [Klebsiella variicola]